MKGLEEKEVIEKLLLKISGMKYFEGFKRVFRSAAHEYVNEYLYFRRIFKSKTKHSALNSFINDSEESNSLYKDSKTVRNSYSSQTISPSKTLYAQQGTIRSKNFSFAQPTSSILIKVVEVISEITMSNLTGSKSSIEKNSKVLIPSKFQ